MTALGLSTMRQLIEQLPFGERRLICMRWSDGLSDLEIARITGDDPERVTIRLDALEQVLFGNLQEALKLELEVDSAAAA